MPSICSLHLILPIPVLLIFYFIITSGKIAKLFQLFARNLSVSHPIAAGCTVPSMYQGLWANGWSTMTLTTAGVYNDRGNFICSGIYGYADEPEAKTILFKDP